MKVTLVVPTIRNDRIQTFFEKWKWDTTDITVIVVEDNPTKTCVVPDTVQHYAWDDIDRDLQSSSWIIPRRTDCIRSYGYWKAYQTGSDVIMTLDDDCYPMIDTPAFIQHHCNNLLPRYTNAWASTLTDEFPRGYPYGSTAYMKDTWISHGLWENVRDYDSITQLVRTRANKYPEPIAFVGTVGVGLFYPMCGMNLAWKREATPLMYFLLMGQDSLGKMYPYDRFGDIWAGIFSKKILDFLGYGVYSGTPNIWHDRASNVWSNFDKEHAGIKANEDLWSIVQRAHLSGSTPAACYHSLADSIAEAYHESEYWGKTTEAMHVWAKLFE